MRLNRTIAARVGVIAALTLLFAAYVWRHSTTTYQFEEVAPNVLYRASLRAREDFVNAVTKSDPRTIYAIGNTEEQANEVLDAAVRYGAKNKIKAHPLSIDPGKAPSAHQIDLVIQRAKDSNRRPVLLLGLDGERPGMIAAAVRLRQMNMPLDKVLELAALSDAPPETTQAIRDFARKYAATMTTAPSTVPAAEASAPQ